MKKSLKRKINSKKLEYEENENWSQALNVANKHNISEMLAKEKQKEKKSEKKKERKGRTNGPASTRKGQTSTSTSSTINCISSEMGEL